jgi:hypothetical protein
VYTVGSSLNNCDEVGALPCPAGAECTYKEFSLSCAACQVRHLS